MHVSAFLWMLSERVLGGLLGEDVGWGLGCYRQVQDFHVSLLFRLEY